MAFSFSVDTDKTLMTALAYYLPLSDSAGFVSTNKVSTETSMSYTTGIVGNCGSFNGTNARIQYLNSGNLNTLSGSCSLSVWVKPTSLPTEGNIWSIVNKYDATATGGGYDLRIYKSGGTNYVGIAVVNSSGTGGAYDYSCTLSTSAWSHIVWTFTSGSNTHQVWVNGTSIGATSSAIVPGNSVKLLNIGNFGLYTPSGPAELGRYFTGLIDEVGFWRKALSTQERADLYNSGNGNALSWAEHTGTWATLASDDFNRADGAIGSNWSATAMPGTNAGSMVILSNRAHAAGATWEFSGNYYSAVTATQNQRITATLANPVVTAIWARMYTRVTYSGGAWWMYWFDFRPDGTVNTVYKTVNSVDTNMFDAGSLGTMNSSTPMRWSAVGNHLKLEVYTGGSWSTRYQCLDPENSVTSGPYTGLFIQNYSTFGWDDFSVQDLHLALPFQSISIF